MSRRRAIPLCPLVVAASFAVLLSLSPGATAGPRANAQPRSKWISIELPKRNGWRVRVNVATQGKIHTPVSIDALGPHRQNLTYGAKGKLTKGNAIVATFPGVGRIDVAFDPTKTKESADEAEPGCTVPRGTLSSEGTFRGKIAIDDPKSFGSFDLRAAPGRITDFPAETCPVKGHRRPGGEGAAETNLGTEEPESDRLHASRKLLGGQLSFDVEALEAGGPFGKKGAPKFNFSADFSRSRHGLSVFATATAALASSGFTVSGPAGAPTEATIEPPAPFHGSATFKLESSTAASWSGDLSVEIPTLGDVRLTGPPFWSILCAGTSCTETLPPGVRFGFLKSD